MSGYTVSPTAVHNCCQQSQVKDLSLITLLCSDSVFHSVEMLKEFLRNCLPMLSPRFFNEVIMFNFERKLAKNCRVIIV